MLMLETIGANKSLAFPEFFLMKCFERLIPLYGSTNLCTTGFGERTHKHLERHKDKTNHRAGQGEVTSQASTYKVIVRSTRSMYMNKLSSHIQKERLGRHQESGGHVILSFHDCLHDSLLVMNLSNH